MRPRNAAVPPHFRLIYPFYPYDWTQFSSITIELFIRQVNGAPTAWSLDPRLVRGITSTRGYQDTNDYWQKQTRAESVALCRGEKWLPKLEVAPGVPAAGDQPAVPAKTVALPQLWSATIENPPANLRIDWGESGDNIFTMTGGTNPELQLAYAIYGKAV